MDRAPRTTNPRTTCEEKGSETAIAGPTLAGIETVIREGKILHTSRLRLLLAPPTLGGTTTMMTTQNHNALQSRTKHQMFLPLEAIRIALTKGVTGAQVAGEAAVAAETAVAVVVQNHLTTRAQVTGVDERTWVMGMTPRHLMDALYRP